MLELKGEPHGSTGLESQGDHQATAHGSTDVTVIPDAGLLFGGQYQRVGTDLILSDHGNKFTVHDYFRGLDRPLLLSPDGGRISADVVDSLTGHGPYAQAGAAAQASTAVGRVVKFSGNATIVRNGVAITVQSGEAILKGDVLQTGTGSMVVTFNDGSTLQLTANSRLAVSEFVYDTNGANHNSELLNLVQGSLTAISGAVAHSGGRMDVSTPVATLGIRGTSFTITIGSDGHIHITVINSSRPNDVVLQDENGNVISQMQADGTTHDLFKVAGQLIQQATQLTDAQKQQLLYVFQTISADQQLGQQLISQGQQAQSDTHAGSTSGSSTSQTLLELDIHLDNTTSTAGLDNNGAILTALLVVQTTTTDQSTGATQTVSETYNITSPANNSSSSQSGPTSQTVAGSSSTDTSATEMQSGLTLHTVAGPSYTDTSATDTFNAEIGVLSGSDTNTDTTLTYGIVGGHSDNSLNGYDTSRTSSYGTLYVNSSTGAYTYVPNAVAINALSADTTDNFALTVSDGANTVEQPYTVTLHGVNDAPVVNRPVTGTATEDGAAAALNAFANASDVDSGTTFSVVNLPNSLPAGVTFDGAHTFTLDPSDPAYQYLAAGETIIVTVDYGVSDGSISSPASMSWVVTGVNDKPLLENFTLNVVQGAATVLTMGDFGIVDPDSSSFTFTVSGVTGGHFEVFDGGSWGPAVSSFTTAQIATGDVRFVQDGSTAQPAFSVQASDGTDVSAVINATVNLDAAVELTVPNGAPVQEGQQLRAFATFSGLDAGITDVTYEWQSSTNGGASWSDIGSGTTVDNPGGVPRSFLQLTESDEGKEFRVLATYTDHNGNVVTATSTATTPAIDITPVITVPFSYALDELRIVKNGTQIYDNPFTTDAPPSSTEVGQTGDTHATAFYTSGSTWTIDNNGKAILSAEGATPTTPPTRRFSRFPATTC